MSTPNLQVLPLVRLTIRDDWPQSVNDEVLEGTLYLVDVASTTDGHVCNREIQACWDGRIVKVQRLDVGDHKWGWMPAVMFGLKEA